MSQPVACTLGPQSLRNRTDPPTPLGREFLTYPVFAAVDRRLLVLEARMLTEDLGS